MRTNLLRLYKDIKKCPLLLDIIDATKYPMTPMEYRRALNMPGNAYVNVGLKKLRRLGVFKIPINAKYGKVHIFTETGDEIKRERCRESNEQYDYFEPSLKWKIYGRIIAASRRRKVIKVMKEEFEPFTQIYKKTALRFEKVNDTLREFIRLGIAVQERTRGEYKLNRVGINIRNFINRIDDMGKQKETGSTSGNNPAPIS
ncbi:MAG: hypothetical protein V1762_02845 [Nitrospirota bacterium]